MIYNVDNSRGKAAIDILKLLRKQYGANNNNISKIQKYAAMQQSISFKVGSGSSWSKIPESQFPTVLDPQLFFLIRKGHYFLYEKEIVLFLITLQKRPLLHIACERGAWNCVKYLVSGIYNNQFWLLTTELIYFPFLSASRSNFLSLKNMNFFYLHCKRKLNNLDTKVLYMT